MGVWGGNGGDLGVLRGVGGSGGSGLHFEVRFGGGRGVGWGLRAQFWGWRPRLRGRFGVRGPIWGGIWGLWGLL